MDFIDSTMQHFSTESIAIKSAWIEEGLRNISCMRDQSFKTIDWIDHTAFHPIYIYEFSSGHALKPNRMCFLRSFYMPHQRE